MRWREQKVIWIRNDHWILFKKAFTKWIDICSYQLCDTRFANNYSIEGGMNENG